MSNRSEIGWKYFRRAPYLFSSSFCSQLGLTTDAGFYLYFFSGIMFLIPVIGLAIAEGMSWIRVPWYWNVLFVLLIGLYIRPISMYFVFRRLTRSA